MFESTAVKSSSTWKVRPPVLIAYRSFRNSDPPALADIWRTRTSERGLMQPMSARLFDEVVLAKPYFDNQGLIVAVADDGPVGFVHAGFGPNDDESHLCYDLGVTCMLQVRPNYRRHGIGSELLKRSEAYMRSRGAKVLYGGGIRPINPFYLGLYGGSELPGVLDTDSQAQRRYKAAGYRSIDRSVVLHRDLSTFRPIVDRCQIQIRRRTSLEIIEDPPSSSWWEACTLGIFDRTRFDLYLHEGGRRVASTFVWHMDPLAASWGIRAVGLVNFEVDPEHRREGYATFLLGEAFRQLQQEGVALVEAQTMQHNTAALALYKRLGFEVVDHGTVYRKEADG